MDLSGKGRGIWRKSRPKNVGQLKLPNNIFYKKKPAKVYKAQASMFGYIISIKYFNEESQFLVGKFKLKQIK